MSPQNRGPDIAEVTPEEIKRSTRYPEVLQQALRVWLSQQLKGDAPPEVSEVRRNVATPGGTVAAIRVMVSSSMTPGPLGMAETSPRAARHPR